MLLFLVVVFAFYGRAEGFFDYSDIEDPLSLFWTTKRSGRQFGKWDNILRDNLNACTATLQDGKSVQGNCKNPADCHFSKGIPLEKSTCPGFFSKCCYYARSCGKETRSKLSYFTSGAEDVLQDNLCNFRIHINNDNVCQIRLDFEKLSLEIPTTTTGDAYKCSTDQFYVTPNANNIPPICGLNDGQHVYITVNEGTKLVTLTMRLGDRSVGDRLLTPEWKIKVRQLECPKISTFFDKANYGQLIADYPLLAPNYTVQHFIDKSGYIQTFGFNEKLAANKYVNDQNYAISFRRTSDVCGIRFTSEHFQVNYNTSYDNIPSTSVKPNMDTFCYDYLFIPAISKSTNNTVISKVCGSDPSTSVTALPPGPLYVYFYANQTYRGTPTNNDGFKMRYQLLTTC